MVAPGLDRADRQLLDRIAIGDGLHPQIVGDQHAAKPELAAQQLGRDPARQRRRPIGIERRIEHVRRHERLHPGARGGGERRQLHPAQALEIVRHDRQLVVRIGARVAVTGEVLAAADQARAAQPAPERQRVRRHRLGGGAERAVADHRVGGVRVHVEHRREVPADAERRQLVAERPPDRRRARGIARRPRPTASAARPSAGARTRWTTPPS